jgi:inosine triphosphate pyrophosphatase
VSGETLILKNLRELIEMDESKQLIIATGNKNKLKEFQDMLKGYDIIAIPVDTLEIQGTAEEVILEKAKRSYDILKKRCMVEDTSFEFEEWNGLPGPYIKDFLKHLGYAKLAYLTTNKNAKTVCLIALVNSAEDIVIFKGEVNGKVVKMKGDYGFEFDKVFIPDGQTKRFAEMTFEEKNQLSHRNKAITKLKEYLDKNG